MTTEQQQLEAAIAALESQRVTLGDAVLQLATAPLRVRLAALLRSAGLKHRLVTVLFADVVGSTGIANGMEAEDTLGLLSAALRRMAALVEAHHGRGDHGSAMRLFEQGLNTVRRIGDRREEALLLRYLANLHLQQGDAKAAWPCCLAAQALHQSLTEAMAAADVSTRLPHAATWTWASAKLPWQRPARCWTG